MTADLLTVADMASDMGWHAWQASAAGLAALGLAAIVRSRAPRAAAALVSLALLKFLVPPLRSPLALGDTAAMMINPFALCLQLTVPGPRREACSSSQRSPPWGRDSRWPPGSHGMRRWPGASGSQPSPLVAQLLTSAEKPPPASA